MAAPTNRGCEAFGRRRAASPEPARRPGRLVRGLDRLFDWAERVRQRRALDSLDDHMLKDIGVSRADVEGEIRKPFWRP